MKTTCLTLRISRCFTGHLFALAALAFWPHAASAQLLGYEPFDYPAGELLCPEAAIAQRTDADGRYWISGTSATAKSDAAIVADNLSFPGLATSTGGSMTNGSGASQQSNRYVFSPGAGINEGTLYVSFLMRVDHLGATFQGAPNQQGILTGLGYYNAAGTFIQTGLLWVGAGTDSTSYRLGAKRQAASPFTFVQWATDEGGDAHRLFCRRYGARGAGVHL